MSDRINLTDSEWVSLLDAESEDSGLPICCANVSVLRDTIGMLLRGGKTFNTIYAELFLKQYEIFMDSHDFRGVALNKLVEQARVYLAQGDR